MATTPTAAQLKALYEENEEGGRYFFTRATMKFFGDTMANYGVRRVRVVDKYPDFHPQHANGQPFDALELFRCRPVKHGLASSDYFTLDGKQLAAVREV